MDLQEIKEYIPETNTVNKDRKYYIKNNIFIKTDEDVNRGKSEAKFLEQLNHKYIQKYIDSYTKDGLSYMETAYFNGVTLENNLFSDNEIITIQSQMLEVISYLTTKGIKHGDINVSNIMFDGNSILLIDFETASYGDPIDDLFGEYNHQGVVNTLNIIKRRI